MFIWSRTARTGMTHRAVPTGDPDWPWKAACGAPLNLAAALTAEGGFHPNLCPRCFPPS